MRNIATFEQVEFTYWTPGGDRTVTINEDDVTGIVYDPVEKEVIEWFTGDTPWETIVNFATSGADFYYRPEGENIRRGLKERELYADCFNIELSCHILSGSREPLPPKK